MKIVCRQATIINGASAAIVSRLPAASPHKKVVKANCWEDVFSLRKTIGAIKNEISATHKAFKPCTSAIVACPHVIGDAAKVNPERITIPSRAKRGARVEMIRQIVNVVSAAAIAVKRADIKFKRYATLPNGIFENM